MPDEQSVMEKVEEALIRLKESKDFYHAEAQELRHLQKDLQTTSLPIGAIVDYIGPIESGSPNPEQQLIQGHLVWVRGYRNWAVCNGAIVPDGQYADFLKQLDGNPAASGLHLPDFRGRFAKGVTMDQIGKTGGVASNTLDFSHKHQLIGAPGHLLHGNGWVDIPGNLEVERSQNITQAALDKITLDNEPSYVGVLKIVRIK